MLPTTFGLSDYLSLYDCHCRWSSGLDFYEKEESKAIGERYRMQYQQIFRDRVMKGARSLVRSGCNT